MCYLLPTHVNPCRQRYLDKHNQATVDHVVKEVKGIDPSAPTFQIRGQCAFEFLLFKFHYNMLWLQKLENAFFSPKLKKSLLRPEESMMKKLSSKGNGIV